MNTVSEKIANWVYDAQFSIIPQKTVNLAKRCILDFIGVALAASREPAATIIRRYINEFKGKEEAGVIGLATRVAKTEAALANGILGHLLDYDDYIQPMPGAGGPHITAVIFPAALAITESGKKTGKQLLEAYILGTEITYRLGRAIEPEHHLAGWHNTETEGIFGATVAASKLLNLNREEITYALGISASEASGLRENFGTMTKPFHAGQANAKGIRSAIMAKQGFTSSKTAFEGKSGFFNVLCKNVRVDEITDNLGQSFGLHIVKQKLYPCCGGSHCSIDATLDLVGQYDINAEDIEEVNVKVAPSTVGVLMYENPRTAFEGKFSMQFPLALAISQRKVTMDIFTDDKIRETEIISLMKKIKLISTPELFIRNSSSRPQIVEIKLKDGRKLVKELDYPRGTPENPLSNEELFQKYKICAGLVLTEKEIDETFETIMNLDQIDNISPLVETIKGY